MQVRFSINTMLGGPSRNLSETPSDIVEKRRERQASIFSKEKCRLQRLSDASQLQIAQPQDLDPIYALFQKACKVESEASGFLRETYHREEFDDLIAEGNVRVLRDAVGTVAAFAVVVPGDHKKFALERLAVGFKIFGVFIKTCTWLDGDFKPLDWPNVRYAALFAQSPKHIISPDLGRKLVHQLRAEDPTKEIYLSVSAEPKTNHYMTALVQELGFQKVAYFRSALGRPIAYVNGTKWLRPWRSDIYRF